MFGIRIGLWSAGVVLHPSTTAYMNRVIAAGGSLNAAEINAVNKYFIAIASIRSKIVRQNFFIGDGLTAALVPAIYNSDGSSTPVGNATDTNTGFVSGDYSRAGGLGDAANSSKFLNTGVNPSLNDTLQQNKMTIGVWTLDNQVHNAVLISCWDAVNGVSMLYSRRSGNQAYTAINNSGGATPNVNVTDERGMNLLTRLSSTSYTYTLNNADQGITQSSAAESNTTFLIFRYNTSYGRNKLSGYIIADLLSSADRTVLFNAWSALVSGVGR